MYPACILHVSDTLFQDTHASLYPACILNVSRMYLSRYDRIHHGSMYSPCIPRVQPVGIRTSGCILLYPIVSWCIPEAHGSGHVWGCGYVYRSVSCVYPDVFHPLLKIHVGYIQNTPGYIKHNVSLSQTTGYKNTFQNTSEYTRIQYSSRIHQNTSEYIRILYS